MNLKKVLLSGLSFVLVAAIAIGGTVAYLTSEDSDVNVMTLGNVSIEQHEYQRAEGVDHNAGEAGAGNGVKEGDLVPFVQGQKLYPAVPANNAATDYSAEATDLFFWGDYVYSGTAGNGLWNEAKLSNVMDKMVFVENTGKSDAYFRTIIAFECPEGITIGEPAQGAEIMTNINGSAVYNWENVGYITVDGVRYLVMEATYQNALKPGNQSHPSLLQVVMTHNATNEDMELLGDTYEILVLSQAVQTAGFADAQTALDTAFGKTSEKAAEWFEGTVIPVYATDAEQVAGVLENGGELFLEEDIASDSHVISEDKTVDINLQDNTLSGIVYNEGNLTVSDGKVEANYVQNVGTATFTDVEMKAGTATDYSNISSGTAAETTYDNVNIASAGGGVAAVGGAKVVFNSGEVAISSTSTSQRYNFYAAGAGTEITINDGTFSFEAYKQRSYICASNGATIIVNGGTFGVAPNHPRWTTPISVDANSSVIIKGGTFGFDPSAWVADGYEAVKDGNVWVVSAK